MWPLRVPATVPATQRAVTCSGGPCATSTLSGMSPTPPSLLCPPPKPMGPSTLLVENFYQKQFNQLQAAKQCCRQQSSVAGSKAVSQAAKQCRRQQSSVAGSKAVLQAAKQCCSQQSSVAGSKAVLQAAKQCLISTESDMRTLSHLLACMGRNYDSICCYLKFNCLRNCTTALLTAVKCFLSQYLLLKYFNTY